MLEWMLFRVIMWPSSSWPAASSSPPSSPSSSKTTARRPQIAGSFVCRCFCRCRCLSLWLSSRRDLLLLLLVLFSSTQQNVISTGAAHAFVSSGVERSLYFVFAVVLDVAFAVAYSQESEPKTHNCASVTENPTFQALGSGIYWMVTVNVVVWMVAPLVAVTVRG